MFSLKKGQQKIVNLLFFLTFMFTFSVLAADETLAVIEEVNKDELWDQKAKEVDNWTDRMNLKVDKNIKDTVIVLNLLNIPTVQSCEGHLKWGLPYPWIEIETDTPQVLELIQQAQGIESQIEEEERLLKEQFPLLNWNKILMNKEAEKLRGFYQQRLEIFDEVDRIKHERLATLYDLLNKFYQNGSPYYDHTLILAYNRLESLGGMWQNLRTDKEKKEKLKAYQNELQDFTEFLIDYYYKN